MGTAAMTVRRSFTSDEALAVATELGIDFKALRCDLEQFRMGMDVELEHGLRDPETNVTGSAPITTGKIALAHLKELPDYYTPPSRPRTRSGCPLEHADVVRGSARIVGVIVIVVVILLLLGVIRL